MAEVRTAISFTFRVGPCTLLIDNPGRLTAGIAESIDDVCEAMQTLVKVMQQEGKSTDAHQGPADKP